MNRVHHKDPNSTSSKKLDPISDAVTQVHHTIEKAKHALSPEVEKMLAFARARYDEYMPIAQKFDDSQEKFSSTAANLLKANELIAKIALRSKQMTETA